VLIDVALELPNKNRSQGAIHNQKIT
jgi:hypothetical protein